MHPGCAVVFLLMLGGSGGRYDLQVRKYIGHTVTIAGIHSPVLP